MRSIQTQPAAALQAYIASIPDNLLTIAGEKALRDVLWLAAGNLRSARYAGPAATVLEHINSGYDMI